MEDKHCIAQIEVAAGDNEVALIFRNLSPLTEQDELNIQEFAQQFQYKVFLQPGDLIQFFVFILQIRMII